MINFDDETDETVMSELSDDYFDDPRILGGGDDLSSASTDYKSYFDEERLMKLEAESENTKKRIPINDEKIESTEYNVSDDFGNSQQQSKQNQKDQFLDSANQQMNDNSADLAQRLEKVKKEGILFCNLLLLMGLH